MTRCETKPIEVENYQIVPALEERGDSLVLSAQSPVQRDQTTEESFGDFLTMRYASLTQPISRTCTMQTAPFRDIETYLANWTSKTLTVTADGLDVQSEVKAFVDDTRADPYRKSQHQLDEPYLLASARKCMATLEKQAESFGATFASEHFKSDMERAVATALKPYQKEFSWILGKKEPFPMAGKDLYRLVRVENLAKDWLPADNDLRKEIGRILDIAQKHGRFLPE